MTADRTILIDGEWVGSSNRTETENPADLSEVVGHVEWADALMVRDAGQAAATASRRWGQTSSEARAEILHEVANLLVERRSELGRLAVREQGKTLKEAVGEVDRGVAVFRFFAGEAMHATGDVFPSIKPGALSYAEHVPVGPVAVITPFNFPILVPCWKLAPALAYGNSVVWKPSELTSLTAAALTRVIVDAGVPPGVVNLVPGGAEVGRAVVELEELGAVTFTGSTGVGRLIQRSLAGRPVGLQLEMGGKNPAVVLDQAPVVPSAVSIIKGACSGTGQRCTALSRALVPRDRLDEFVAAFETEAHGWQIGDGFDPNTSAGPLTQHGSVERIESALAHAASAGASIVSAGTLTSDRSGHWIRPTIVAEIDPSAPIACEELFAPVLAVIAHDGFDHAIELANNTPFGLNAAVYTPDLDEALRAVGQLDVGMVQVNADAGVAPHVPFVGIGDSGYGPPEQSAWARHFFTRAKSVNIHPKVR